MLEAAWEFLPRPKLRADLLDILKQAESRLGYLQQLLALGPGHGGNLAHA